ncbi:hypothetical protein D3C79_627480 [compost metagenome]
MLKLLDYLRHRIDDMNVELQAGTQTDLIKNIGRDATKLMVFIKEGQRCEVFVYCHTQPWVLFDPGLLSSAQIDTVAIEQHAGAAAGPAT